MIDVAARRRFLQDYAAIRHAEGRGSSDSSYYLALPYADLSGCNSAQWRIRARTFDYFKRHILPRRPCRILDLGGGNCWLSYRLAQLGHTPVALDIFADSEDGLAAVRHYPRPLAVVEADFHQLPFAGSSFDLIVFNSSIHYSNDYGKALRAAKWCLRSGGRLIILDSPIYKRREYGEAMKAERQEVFARQFGRRSEALGSIEYFDVETLSALAKEFSVTWRIHRPWYGLRWHLRPVQAWIKRRRPPSRFWILEGVFA